MKKGFTLAEILVTLGVVGTLAAITLPTLMENTSISQIGPKLAKAVTNFEQANMALLQSYQSDSLLDTGLLDNKTDYGDKLLEFLRISKLDDNEFITKDGMLYSVSTDSIYKGGDSTLNHRYMVGQLIIDINGPADPNNDATDRFYFGIMNDGSLTPYGSSLYADITGVSSWKDTCGKEKFPTNPKRCAGHIFENNLQVLYK